MSDAEDRRGHVRQAELLLDALEHNETWAELRASLVDDYVREMDDLVVKAAQLDEPEIRARLGRLLGKRDVVTVAAQRRVKLAQLDRTLEARVKAAREVPVAPTVDAELDQQIESIQEWLAKDERAAQERMEART